MLPELLARLKQLETDKIELASQLQASKAADQQQPARPERKFVNPEGPPLTAEEALRIRAEKSGLPPSKPEQATGPESATLSPKLKTHSFQLKLASSPSPSSTKPALCDAAPAPPTQASAPPTQASAPEPSPASTRPPEKALPLKTPVAPVVEKINSVTHRKEHAALVTWLNELLI